MSASIKNGIRERGRSIAKLQQQTTPKSEKIESNRFVRLFIAWLFAQCFLYTEIGYSVKVGITISPDRALFGILILAFLLHQKRLQRPVSTMEWLMLAFTV